MRRSRFATMLLVTAALLAPAEADAGRGGSGRVPPRAVRPSRAPAATVRLPAGSFRPLYGRPGDPAVAVTAFHLDRDQVTRGEFLSFVRANPAWRRSAVSAAVADRAGYLADWRGDHDAGGARDLDRPVTGVSRLAARAYCAARGKRLPTMAEWEYAAAASERVRDAARDPRFVQRLVSLYASRPRPLPAVGGAPANVYGVRGLHSLVWEWVEDLDVTQHVHAGHDAGPRGRDLSCAGAALGAVDPTNYAAFLRYAMRAGLTDRSTLETLGFRCAA